MIGPMLTLLQPCLILSGPEHCQNLPDFCLGFFFFLVVLGFELMDLSFLTGALLLEPYFQPFCFSFQIGSQGFFCPDWPLTEILRLLQNCEITRVTHHIQLHC
jgi:hypothetical protein